MIDWLIFSKDRPCQLDALLQTMERYMQPLVRTVSCLYCSSAPEYDQGYGIVRMRFPWAWAVPDVDFPAQVRVWIERATGYPAGRVGFLCDDDLFYRDPDLPAGEPPLPFSFRLGLNCIRQHPTGLAQALPLFTPPEKPAPPDNVVSWDWKGSEGDFGYPFSLDGHVYPQPLALSLVSRLGFFSDPTTLEAGIASDLPDSFPQVMHAGLHSSLVSVPVNRVTVNSRNPVMADGPSPADLNYYYLRGRRIDPFAMDYSRVDGAHAELPYVYTY